MKERKLKEWEKNIKVLFERGPQLKNLIKNPVYCSNTPWAGEVNRYFLESTVSSAGEDFYRIVFKQGAPKSLMTIGSGELSGLKKHPCPFNVCLRLRKLSLEERELSNDKYKVPNGSHLTCFKQ